MLKLFIKLKKELIDFYQKLEGQILESNSFNILKERYQSLTILNQKLIKFSLIALLAIVTFSLPVYYLSSSTMAWFQLKEKHRLSQELLKMREKSSFSKVRDTESILKSKINRLIQKYSSENFTMTQESKKFPKSDFIDQIIFKIKLPHLNIRQVVQLGTELKNLSQVRLEELTFTENKDYKNHYDISYQLSAFVIKKDSRQKRRVRRRGGIEKEESSQKAQKKKGTKSRKKTRKEKEEEESSNKTQSNKKPSGLKKSERTFGKNRNNTKTSTKPMNPLKSKASLIPPDTVPSPSFLPDKGFDLPEEEPFKLRNTPITKTDSGDKIDLDSLESIKLRDRDHKVLEEKIIQKIKENEE